ncbi:prosaposin receptor GPR37 [Lethenteron reissneri]|uniref:prosaposin receptor GPR37 n=1 Tax=Lethenteron reissneri TaxID=7753 RepID=UPI002AB60B69|nr:prosaposin receptor GPR37 [Lethenteron reissneri]
MMITTTTTTTMMMIWAVLGVAAGALAAFPTALGEGAAPLRDDARPPAHKESLLEAHALYGSDVDEDDVVVVGHGGGGGNDDDGGGVVRGREATRGEEASTFDEDGGRRGGGGGGGGTFRNLPSAVPPFVPARAFEVRRKRQAAGKTVNAENARSPTPPAAPPSPPPPSAAAATTAAEDVNAQAEQTDATSIPHSPRPALADNGTEVDTEVDLSSPGQSSSSSSSSSDNITEASDHSPKVITPKSKSASGRVERIPRARNPFKPVTSETYGAYAILAFSLFLFAVGLASNLTVICVVCNNRYMKNVSNSLLANMAFWDFLVIFVCLPLTAVHELSKRWVLGDFTCKLVPYLEVASLGITTFTLAALCLDRFHAATNVRLHYEQTEGCISRGGKLAVVWLGALVLSTPELLIHGLAGKDGVNSNNNNNHHHHYQGHQNTQQQGVAVAGGAPTGSSLPYDRCEMRVPHELPDFLYMLSATYRAARPWWFFGCYFCLPIAFTVTCSVLTARRMKGAGAAAHNKPPPGEAGPATSLTRGSTRQQLRLERQMNCAVVALATAYACCLVPEIVCSMVWEYAGVGGGESPALDVLHTVAQYLLFSKSCLGPVLLLGLCRELARAARACCCCCCPCPETGGGESSAEMPSSPAPPGGGGGGAVVALSPCVVTAASDENENERPAGEMELFTFSTVQRELTTFSTA